MSSGWNYVVVLLSIFIHKIGFPFWFVPPMIGPVFTCLTLLILRISIQVHTWPIESTKNSCVLPLQCFKKVFRTIFCSKPQRFNHQNYPHRAYPYTVPFPELTFLLWTEDLNLSLTAKHAKVLTLHLDLLLVYFYYETRGQKYETSFFSPLTAALSTGLFPPTISLCSGGLFHSWTNKSGFVSVGTPRFPAIHQHPIKAAQVLGFRPKGNGRARVPT